MEDITKIMASVTVGVPLAWYVMEGWLSGYPFRVGMTWWLFVVPVAVIVTVMLATVGSRVWITLRSNPIRSLKAE